MNEESIAQLQTCARRLAAALQLPAPPDAAIEATIRRVVIDRHALAAAAAGIITRGEAANLLLAHLHALICDHARAGIVDCVADARLHGDVERALFEHSR